MEEHHYLVIKHVVIHGTRGMPARQDCPLIKITKKDSENKPGFAMVSLLASSRPCSLSVKHEEQCSLVKQRNRSHL